MSKQKRLTEKQVIESYNRLKVASKIAVELGVPNVTIYRWGRKLGLVFENGKHCNKKIDLDEILQGKHPQYQTLKLKNRLIKENILTYMCDICGIKEWNNNQIALQLDHIDGNSSNHLLSNLRLLCPNCHSQTDTWCGKNIKK